MVMVALLQAGWAQRPDYPDVSALHTEWTLQSGDLLFLNENKTDMEKAINISMGEHPRCVPTMWP